jgi:hypothetical protein
MVWFEDRWIKDKVLGDGFGFTRHDLQIMQSAVIGGGPGFIGGPQQEAFMITGGYHNGPLSAIRYGGLVGLFFVGLLLVLLAARAVRLINQTRGSPLFISALFVCLPVVFAPAGFVFMAGAYDNALQDSFFSWGLMKILQDVAAPSDSPETITGKGPLHERVRQTASRELALGRPGSL